MVRLAAFACAPPRFTSMLECRVSSHIPPISEFTPKFRAFQDTYPDSPYEIFITRIRALLVGLYLDSAYILVQSRIRLFQMVIYPY